MFQQFICFCIFFCYNNHEKHRLSEPEAKMKCSEILDIWTPNCNCYLLDSPIWKVAIPWNYKTSSYDSNLV